MSLPVISSNTPTVGYIRWTASKIVYAGSTYPIPFGETNKRFVYWDKSASTPGVLSADGDTLTGGTSTLVAVDTLPDPWNAEDALVFLNKSGVGLLAPSTSVIDGSLIVTGSILADAIGANQINTDKLAANSVTALKIAANAITSGKIAANQINANHVSAGAISASKLSIGAYTQNLAPNPYFEDWDIEYANEIRNPSLVTNSSFWGGTNTTRTRVNTWSESGSWSMSIAVTAAGSTANFFAMGRATAPVNRVPAVFGDYISARVRIKATKACRARFRLTMYNAAGTTLSSIDQDTEFAIGEEKTLERINVLISEATCAGFYYAVQLYEPGTTTAPSTTGEWVLADSYRVVNHGQVPTIDTTFPYLDGFTQGYSWESTIGNTATIKMADGWAVSNAVGYENATVTRETAVVISGAHSVGLKAAASNQAAIYAPQPIPVMETQDVYVGCYYFCATARTNGILAGLYFLDSAFEVIEAQSTTADISAGVTGLVQHVGIAPAGARYFQPIFVTDSTVMVLIDNTELAYRQSGATIKDGTLTIDAVDTDFMKADNIVAGELTADLTLGGTGKISALGDNGTEVSLAGNEGFRVVGYDEATGSNPTTIHFPTNGQPNIIGSKVNTVTLQVEGDEETLQAATFRRNSQFEPGATLTLNNQVIAPVSGPIVENVVDNTTITIPDSGSLLYKNAVSMHSVQWNPTTTSLMIFSSNKLWNWNTTSEILSETRDFTNHGVSYRGAVKIGTEWWLLRAVTPNEASIWRLNSSWTILANRVTSTGGNIAYPIITTDGTDIYLAYRQPDLGLGFAKYTVATDTWTYYTSNTVFNSTTYPTSLVVGSMDFGATRFVLSSGYVGGYFLARAYSISGTVATEVANDNFLTQRADKEHFLTWAGSSNADSTGYFFGVTLDPSVKFYRHKYTKDKTVWRTQTRYVGSTFYRSSDLKETALSPQTVMTYNSRWPWKVTVPIAPAGMTGKVYVGTSATSANAKLQATLASGATALLGVYNASGAAVGTGTTAFGTGSPAVIQSQEAISQTLTGTTASASATVTSTQGRSYMIGRAISGTGIPAATTVIATPGGNLTLSQNATASGSVTLTITLPKLEIQGSGYARITELERVVLTSTTDANTLAGNLPPLRIGDITGQHLRIDGNEMIAMADDDTIGMLQLNQDGTTKAGGGAAGKFQIGNGGTAIDVLETGGASENTNGSGECTYSHGLGLTNYHVLLTSRSNGSLRHLTVINKNTNNFVFRVDNQDGSSPGSGVAISFDYLILGKN